MKSRTNKVEATPETKTTVEQPALVAALEHLFKTEGWEIPDECVVGHFARKVDQLEAQIKSLTSIVAALGAKINAPAPSGRVDVLAAAKGEKK